MFPPWYLCMYCPVLCLSLVNMILFDMRYVGRFRNVRHIWLAALFVRRHLECRPYLILGSKVIWNLLSILCVKLLSWILYLIRITVILCVIGDRYKKSNHSCLITYTCRTFPCGLWSHWRPMRFSFVVCGAIALGTCLAWLYSPASRGCRQDRPSGDS